MWINFENKSYCLLAKKKALLRYFFNNGGNTLVMKRDFRWFDICIRAENSKFGKARKKVNYTLGSVCWDNSSKHDSCAGVTGRDHRWWQVNQMK